MKNRYLIIIFYLALCSAIFFSCSHKQQQSEQSDLEILLSDLVEDRYAHCNQLSKSNEKMNRYKYADEIMEKCNQLIASQDPYREKYKGLRSLMKEYKIDWPYGINGTEMDSMNFALMVRVVQLYALDYEIESFYQSHYQVELLGIEYAGEFRDKKGNRVVRLHPEYISQNPDLNPVYYMNGEKLSTDGTYWYYTPHNSDTIVSFDFDVMRWGQPFHGNCGTKMSFDPKKTTTP
jgi:hypothetical protein